MMLKFKTVAKAANNFKNFHFWILIIVFTVYIMTFKKVDERISVLLDFNR